MGFAEKHNPNSWYNRKRAQRDRAARPQGNPEQKPDPNVAFEFSFSDLFKRIKDLIWRIFRLKKKNPK